jgi:DNA repair exonuclease SbcCD ATPase subunit
MSLSPNVPEAHEAQRYENAGTPRWIAILFVVLFVLVVVVGFFGYTSLGRLDSSLAKANEQNRLLAAQLEQANARLADIKAHVEVAEQKVGMTQAELAQAKSRAEAIRKEQKVADERLAAKLSQVAQESEEKIGAVATEVGGAKKDIEATKSDLETTKSKLERVIGDAGVMSGLIARNREDLEELKRRGERNIFEFTLTKAKTPQRVGPIQLKLQKADAKKQRYTMTVYADDKVFEKKDKNVDEPVQFYVKGGGGRQLYEVVVYELGKDSATGYLTTPKEGPAAAAKPSS